jgi:hypothetical protein
MRQVIWLVLAATLLGGCAVYADPYSFRASVGIFAPAPVAVAPAYRPWRYERYDGWRRG